MKIDDFLSRLDGVRRCGSNSGGVEYMARCPAHDDTKASLSVSCGRDGKLLVYCHAGCRTEDILAKMGLTMQDLYPKSSEPATREAEYVYRDVSGNPLLRKVKQRNADGSKSFFWQRWDGGQWKYGRGGIVPPLYGLESLTSESACFVVEGEKDADTMHRLGYPCVSLPDGASSKWQASYAQAFVARDVYIIPDNDVPGQKYAEMIAQQVASVAKSVSLLDLSTVWSDIPQKGDVSDYVQHVGTGQARQMLRDMAADAKPWRKPEAKGLLACFRTLDTFAEEDADWLVSNLIPKEQITSIVADGGLGKTSIWCDLVASVSAGRPSFLDPPGTVRQPQLVAFCSTEDSVRKKLKRKLRAAGACEHNIITPDFSNDPEGILRDFKFGSSGLATFIREFRPALCVFDPIQGFIPANINMGSRNAMRDCLAPLIGLGEETGTTFLLVCHSNKRKGAYGRDRVADSADIWDISRSVLMLGYTEEQGIRYISNEKNNYAPLQETKLFGIDAEGQIHPEGTTWKRDREFVLDNAANVSAPAKEECKEWILQQLDTAGGKLATKALEEKAKVAGYSHSTLRRAKDELKQAAEIKYYQEGSAKDKTWYVERLALPEGW